MQLFAAAFETPVPFAEVPGLLLGGLRLGRGGASVDPGDGLMPVARIHIRVRREGCSEKVRS